jgi:hypothetical protein
MQIPRNATHAKVQIEPGVFHIHRRGNFNLISGYADVVFGTYDRDTRKFTPLTEQELAATSAPAEDFTLEGSEKFRFIASRLIEGRKTAKQVAEEVVEKFGGTFEKAIGYVRSTPYHVNKRYGRRYSYAPERGSSAEPVEVVTAQTPPPPSAP